MRCPYCGIWIRRKATKCWRCKSVLKDDVQVEQYLSQCIGMIEREFSRLDPMIDDKRGLLFRRYRYAANELISCDHVERIKSIVRKMSDDIENWIDRGKISERTRVAFTLKAEEIEDKLKTLIARIQSRTPSGFEKLRDLLSEIGFFLRQILIPFIVTSVKFRISQVPSGDDSPVKAARIDSVAR